MLQKLILQLKKRQEMHGGCDEIIISGGDIVNACSHFNPPAIDEEIHKLTIHFSSEFPYDYIQFLKCCNGASLFENPQYGGENIIYSIDDVILYNDTTYQLDKIVVANIVDDRIVIDLSRWRNGEEHYLLLCESMNPVDLTSSFYCNFETWLERFIIAQGSKFWYWKTDRE